MTYNIPTKLATFALLALVALAPVASILQPKAIALFFPLAGLFSLPSALPRMVADVKALPRRGGLLLLAGLTLAVLGVITSTHTGRAIQAPIMLGMNLLALWSLLRAENHNVSLEKLMKALALGLCLGTMLVAVEYLFDRPIAHLVRAELGEDDYPLYRYDRTIVVLSLLVWPLAAYLQYRGLKLLAIFSILLGACFLLFETSSQSATLGALLGVAAFALAQLWPRLCLGAARIGMVAFALMAPLLIFYFNLMVEGAPNFWPAANTSARLDIWVAVIARIQDAPLWGHGFNAIRFMTDFTPVTTHPHNGFLQVWLELGLPGALALAFVLQSVVKAIGHCQPKVQPAALAAFVAWLVVFSVGYSIWQDWWQAAGLALLFLFMHLAHNLQPSEKIA